MNLKSSVIKGAFSLGGARLVVTLLNAAGILILARLLTPADFGIVAIATAVLTVAMSATEASIQPALIQCREPTREHLDTVWTLSLIRSFLIFAAMLACAWPLSRAYGDARLVPVLMVSGITGAFAEFYNPRLTMAMREMRFAPTVLFQIGQKSFGLILALVLAIVLKSYWAIIIGNAVGAVAASIGSHFLPRYRPRFSMTRFRDIWGFSGWMFVNQLCETLNWRFDQLVAGLGVTKAQLGFYSMADNLAVIPSRELTGAMRNALFAGLSCLSEQPKRLRASFMRAQSSAAMITAPAAVGLALTADPAVRLLLGEKWVASIPFVQILALTYAIDTFINVVRPLGMAMGQTKYLFLRQLAGLSIRIPLIIAGLISGGLAGAAIGRALGSLANVLISMLIVRRLLGLSVSRQVASHAETLWGLVAMSGVLMLTQLSFPPTLKETPLLQLPLLITLAGLAYCGTIVAIWRLRGGHDGPVSEIAGILAGVFRKRPREGAAT
ncbi:MAG TPA: lipopolysaccharide biosynthesis protein [Novosphingobium sp.]|nr:lipopolysaccharide biosynthesis protein [Novosphingobium sp.]